MSEIGFAEKQRLVLLRREAKKVPVAYRAAIENEPGLDIGQLPNALAFVHLFFESGLANPGKGTGTGGAWGGFAKEEQEAIQAALMEQDEKSEPITLELITFLIHIWVGHFTSSRKSLPQWKPNSEELSYQVINNVFHDSGVYDLIPGDKPERLEEAPVGALGCMVILTVVGLAAVAGGLLAVSWFVA